MQHSPLQNRLLAALPPEVYARLLPHLELVPLALDQVLFEPGQYLQYVHFPTTSLVARLQQLRDGSGAVVGLIGFDGMVGISLFLGDGRNIHSAVVQSEGHAYRLKRQVLQDEFARHAGLRQVLLLYTQIFITQMAQTAICNRLHTLDQQLSRWLLLCVDRAASTTLTMTHSRIADMLGTRRESVTDTAGHLQAEGLLQCKRGKMIVLDRPKLEARACECYAVVRREYERLLPDLTSEQTPGVARSTLSTAALASAIWVNERSPELSSLYDLVELWSQGA